MGRKTVLVDDVDGSELPDGTAPIRLSLGRKSWNLYLSDKNTETLYAALEPFTANAESGTATAPVAAQKHDRERIKAIREWAQANNIKFNGKPIGDRGRIPQDVIDQYEAAN